MLGGDSAELLPEWLRICARQNRISPPELLPALLNFKSTDEELRALKLPILGIRGRWLAAASPTWSWVLGATTHDDSIWETGDSSARRAVLRRVRLQDPARARELLALTWEDDPAEDRAAFIATMGLNLQAEDAPFLESCLEDKRKEVRRLAFQCLSRLPHSGFADRMRARLEPLMTFIPAEAGSLLKLRKATPAKLSAQLPEACDKPMQKDGVEAKAPKGTGERTWWLVQMLEGTPLGTWETQWNQTPADLILAAQQGESGADLLRGWHAAARSQRDGRWAEALLQHAPSGDVTELLELMSDDARQRWFLASLRTRNAKDRFDLLHLLTRESSGLSWSTELSRLILETLRTVCQTEASPTAWQLRQSLRLLAVHLSPETLASTQTGWPTESSPAWDYWQPGIDPFLQLCQLRMDMAKALQS